MRGRTGLLAVVILTCALVLIAPAAAPADPPAPWGPASDINQNLYVYSGITGAFTLPSDTDDVFRLYLLKGERIYVAVDRDPGTGVEVFLYGPGTSTVVDNYDDILIQGTPSPQDADYLGYYYTAQTEGFHYMNVWAPSDGASGNYTLYYTAEWGNATTGVYDNDSTPGVSLRSYGMLEPAIDIDDVYAVPLVAGDNFTAIMTPESPEGAEAPWPAADFDLYLYRPGAPSVNADANSWLRRAASHRGSVAEKISYIAQHNGTHSLDVSVYSGAGDYGLRTGRLTVPAGKVTAAYCYLTPRVTAGSYPVTFYAERKVGGKWVVKATARAKAVTSGSRSKCTARLNLSSRYTWRVRARTTTGGLGTRYTGYVPVVWR